MFIPPDFSRGFRSIPEGLVLPTLDIRIAQRKQLNKYALFCGVVTAR